MVAQGKNQGGTEVGVWEGDTGGQVKLSVWAPLKRVLKKKVLGKNPRSHMCTL